MQELRQELRQLEFMFAAKLDEINRKIEALAKGRPVTVPGVVDATQLLEEIKKTRYLLEMIHFSNRDALYAIAREMGMGSEIYFAAESGWLAAGGGSASWTYTVPDKMVDIAESLGYDPSANRVMTFKWTRDGKVIYEDPNTVRRENVRVYQYSDEAYDYCTVTVTNNDTTNQNAMHVWGYCHFIDKFFYDMIKRRMTSAYPLALFPEIYKQKERPG
jgi:hypothetical protein